MFGKFIEKRFCVLRNTETEIFGTFIGEEIHFRPPKKRFDIIDDFDKKVVFGNRLVGNLNPPTTKPSQEVPMKADRISLVNFPA